MPERGRGCKDDVNQFYLVLFSNPSGVKYSVVQGLSSSMAFFWSFPSDRGCPHCRQQSFPMINLWEKLWHRDQINIIGLKE